MPDEMTTIGPVVVGGPSAVGKTTLVNELIHRYPHIYRRALSVTSRARRPHERDDEYLFRSRDEVLALWKSGQLVNLDEVFGNLYGILVGTIDASFCANRIPIKEIHPLNHRSILAKYANTVRVLLRPLDVKDIEQEQEQRNRADLEDTTSNPHDAEFDLILHVDRSCKPSILADDLHLAIKAVSESFHHFPRPGVIDAGNADGYDRIAAEFTDKRRLTTRDFHLLSLPFLSRGANRYCSSSARCVEIGIGHGWLRTSMHIPCSSFVGVDIAGSMLERAHHAYDEVRQASARALPFPSQSFDVAFGSLIDGFCHPAAIAEIRRVLRPGGFFILTSPSRDWSEQIRNRSDEGRTTFVTSAGERVSVYSFTYLLDEMINILAQCGLDHVESEAVFASRLDPSCMAPAIRDAIDKAQRDVEVVNCVVCRRNLRV